MPDLPPTPENLTVVEWLLVAGFLLFAGQITFLLFRYVPALVNALHEVRDAVVKSGSEMRDGIRQDFEKHAEAVLARIERVEDKIDRGSGS